MTDDYHHFKGDELSRSEKIQRHVVELLLNSDIPDEQRESSICWELKHSSGCCQIGRILAEKRGLDVELAELICVLHDIYVIIHGTYKEHGPKGAPIAEQILQDSNDFTEEEIKTITDAVAHHSEKEIYSENPYIELAKDVDVMDCCIYENAHNYYKLHKPKEIYDEYVKRIKKVRAELGLPGEVVFR
ncbi:MAG: HD domain-containing protein [Candidatus Woesearchaeota archaeon]|nr:HD domain-containing protein [Candidatus Woesearchaeota archaeon]